MGDRANIIVKQGNGDPPVVIYSHWGGNALASRELDNAVQYSQPRAGDPHYFTALFVERLGGMNLVSGIGTSLDDNEHPIFVVDAITGKREPEMSEGAAIEYLREWRNDPGS